MDESFQQAPHSMPEPERVLWAVAYNVPQIGVADARRLLALSRVRQIVKFDEAVRFVTTDKRN